MRILGIPGSLRQESVNRRLLQAAHAVASDEVSLHIYDGLADLPLYNEDIDTDPAPPAVADLRAAIEAADAVLIATPEYNSSIPGPLKNALDWASRPRPGAPLEDKPVAVVGASPSQFGAVWAQAETRKIVQAIGATVVDRELPVAQAFDAFDGDHHLVDPDLAARYAEILVELEHQIHPTELATR